MMDVWSGDIQQQQWSPGSKWGPWEEAMKEKVGKKVVTNSYLWWHNHLVIFCLCLFELSGSSAKGLQ